MGRSHARQIKHLAPNGRIHIIRVVLIRMRSELGRIEDMLSRTDDQAQHGDHKYGTSAYEPDDHVQSELLAPGLTHVLSFHTSEPLQERRRNPPGE